MLKFKPCLPFLFLIIATVFYGKAFCQSTGDFSYLLTCFENPASDTADLEIKGIGHVKALVYNSREMEETGLTYYNVPPNKKNKPASKLAEFDADMHIQTWKNNSRILILDKFMAGDASIIDLRLRLLIENIYMQVIVVCEKGKLYEIMCFRDTNDKAHFDKLTNNIKKKICLNL